MTTFEHYALVIPAGYVQLTFRHTSALVPDEMDCTIGFLDLAPPIDQGDLDDIRDAWVARFLPFMDNAITFTKVDARTAAGVILESPSGATGGYVGSDPDPYNCAVIIKKLTGVAGRRHRGRMYLPIVGGDNTDPGGNLTGAAIIALTAAAEGFRTDVEAATSGTLELLHAKGWDGAVEPADPGNAPAPTTITSLVCAPKIGTQRRRLR